MPDRESMRACDVGYLPIVSTYARTMGVVEEKRVEKIGEALPSEIDFRLITATNRSLDFLKNQKNFRHDLFHRLSAISIAISPLRERVEDIPMLIEHFLRGGPGGGMRITQKALQQLMQYACPGNVRELRNAMELAECVAQADQRDLEKVRLTPPVAEA